MVVAFYLPQFYLSYIQYEVVKIMLWYVHTNIIARNAPKLIAFYKNVFACKSIGETRDLCGEWLDHLTGLANAHIVGEHLCLPGYGDDHPTLEIFSYDKMLVPFKPAINRCGYAHLAFKVDDVKDTLIHLLQEGGSQIGEVVCTQYADGRNAEFVYATDCEGNIIELQSWT